MAEFKTGVKVLIPGTIVETMGSGTNVVETAFGNTIVERSGDLELAIPRDGSVEKRVERLARAMCGADSIDPDERASLGAPLAVASGFLLGSTCFPAWRLYAKYAQALIDRGLA